MQTYRIVLIFLLFFCLQSCLFDGKTTKLNDQFAIAWIDTPTNQAVCEIAEDDLMLVRIPEYVFAVGNDENFIIAKQHPLHDFKIDTSKTNYYIIDLKNPTYDKNGYAQALTLTEFDSLREKHKIKDIEFKLLFSEN